MAQIRFKIGVPRAGSAAREAESSRERFRPLRPEAGSAARQAEEERRAAGADGTPPRHRVATIRVQSRDGQTAGVSPRPDQNQDLDRELGISAQKIDETSQSFSARPPYPEDAPLAGDNSSAPTFGSDAPVRTLPDDTPLQTAAAKVKSLFRSVVSRAKGEN